MVVSRQGGVVCADGWSELFGGKLLCPWGGDGLAGFVCWFGDQTESGPGRTGDAALSISPLPLARARVMCWPTVSAVEEVAAPAPDCEVFGQLLA